MLVFNKDCEITFSEIITQYYQLHKNPYHMVTSGAFRHIGFLLISFCLDAIISVGRPHNFVRFSIITLKINLKPYGTIKWLSGLNIDM